MSRPTNKAELIVANEETFKSLNALLGTLPELALLQTFQFPHRDRNVRDVLAHVLEWQRMMFGWYKVGMRGGDPEMPGSGFSWRETPALNLTIWEACQATTLVEVRSKLRRSHNRLQKLIRQHSNNELFTKKYYRWTGSTPLGIYFRAAGCSHYHWAFKLLRRFAKSI